MASIKFIHKRFKQRLHHLVGSGVRNNRNFGSGLMKNKDGLTIFTRSWLTDGSNSK